MMNAALSSTAIEKIKAVSGKPTYGLKVDIGNDQEISFKYWQGGKVERVYVARNGKSIGYYDLSDGTFYKLGAQYSRLTAAEFAATALAILGL